MTQTELITLAYSISGILLPLFYIPQAIKLYFNTDKLEGYSLSKAFSQTMLRGIAVAFAVFVIKNPAFLLIVCLDLAGRFCELLVAIHALVRQKVTLREIIKRLNPLHPVFQHLANKRRQASASEAGTPEAPLAGAASAAGLALSPLASGPAPTVVAALSEAEQPVAV